LSQGFSPHDCSHKLPVSYATTPASIEEESTSTGHTHLQDALGNPAGYQTPHAIRVDEASLALTPSSLFSDKVIVKSIRI